MTSEAGNRNYLWASDFWTVDGEHPGRPWFLDGFTALGRRKARPTSSLGARGRGTLFLVFRRTGSVQTFVAGPENVFILILFFLNLPGFHFVTK